MEANKVEKNNLELRFSYLRRVDEKQLIMREVQSW